MWRGRTDSNRHRLPRQGSAYAFLPRPQLGGSTGFNPASASFTVRSFAIKLRTTKLLNQWFELGKLMWVSSSFISPKTHSVGKKYDMNYQTETQLYPKIY